MRTKASLLVILLMILSSCGIHAQDRTTVTAATDDISDNLDLRAIASVFGDSRDLEDFERRLNDPELRISNLDLNGDNRVDYLRVVESAERDAHLIIIQAIIGPDLFQDVATIEVERDERNQTRVLVVGDVFMYGQNYIYEPVYYQPPVIYNYFWTVGYRPYFSSWYWGYYPSYYVAWTPYPVYTYVNYVNVHINHHHHYNYHPVRPQGHRAYLIPRPVRGNAYATMYPSRSFETRNTGVRNRQELDNVRGVTPQRTNQTPVRGQNPTPNRDVKNGTRNTRSNQASPPVRNQGVAPRPKPAKKDPVRSTGKRGTSALTAPSNTSTRSFTTDTRGTSVTRDNTPATTSGTRANSYTSGTRAVSAPEPSAVRTSTPVRRVSTPVQTSAPSVSPVRQPSQPQGTSAEPVRQSQPQRSVSAPSSVRSTPAPATQRSLPTPSSGGRSQQEGSRR